MSCRAFEGSERHRAVAHATGGGECRQCGGECGYYHLRQQLQDTFLCHRSFPFLCWFDLFVFYDTKVRHFFVPCKKNPDFRPNVKMLSFLPHTALFRRLHSENFALTLEKIFSQVRASLGLAACYHRDARIFPSLTASPLRTAQHSNIATFRKLILRNKREMNFILYIYYNIYII